MAVLRPAGLPVTDAFRRQLPEVRESTWRAERICYIHSFTGGVAPQSSPSPGIQKIENCLASCDAFMANILHQPDILSDSSTKEEEGHVSEPHVQGHGNQLPPTEAVDKQTEISSAASSSVPPKDPALPNSVPSTSADPRPATNPARPTLVQLGSNSTQPSSSTTPHPPKKFNAVNITKKFLEKNTAAAMATASSTSASNKSNSSISRPQIQSAQSHSRLVTAKLTGSPIPSTTTGPGWSRPNSTAPSSTGTNSPIGSSPLPSAATAVSINTGAPQLPHVGKVIQPQPRVAALQNTSFQKDGSGHKSSAKPAWSSVKPPSVAPIVTSNDFPTAAEVAKATAPRRSKQDDPKSPQESTSGAKDRLDEEADTFRGVHLDPNAHHWGEEEDNDDDFLGGVIEFGDGRQYKVEATEAPTSPPPHDERPVTKEDRFVDDFDRSWPKSKHSPASPPKDIVATSPTSSQQGGPAQGQDSTHPQLFNERSNKLEPYSHSSRQGPSAYPNRRGSHNDGPVQVLQKPGHSDLPPRPRGGGPPSRGGFPGHPGDRRDAGPRRDHPPSPRSTRNDWAHHDMAPSSSLPGREREPVERSRRSDMGPPPLPLHATRRSPREGGRQLPPHLSPNFPSPRHLPPRDPTSPQSSRFGPPSPALSHTSTLALSPNVPTTIPLPAADLNEVTKDLMQTAAARAKARKQQEEAEREAQRERAKKKALELEEKMKASEAEQVKKEQEEKEKKETEEKKAKEQEKEVVEFIQSAVESVEGSKSPLAVRRPSIDAASGPKSLPRRPPSLRGQQRRPPLETGAGPRRPSFGVGTRAPGIEPSPAAQAESWRAKANPLPPSTPRQAHSRPPQAPLESAQLHPVPLSATPSTALDQVADIAETSIGELEIVEFSDMGGFVGGEEKDKDYVETVVVEKVETEPVTSGLPQKPRPTASDFFEDSRTSAPPRNADSSRRKVSVDVEEKPRVGGVKDEPAARPVAGATAAKEVPSHIPPHPRPRMHAEASMSALDDVMSRIKGAIDGMQASGATNRDNRTPPNSSELDHPPASHRNSHSSPNAPKASAHRERWAPPPKSRIEESIDRLREPPHTSSEPSHTPVAAKLTIDLPKVSHRVETVPKRQQTMFSNPPLPVRFELLSFQPPVQGMSKRDLSVNSVLFRQTPGFKSNKIRVALPRSKAGPVIPRMVNMVGTKTNNAGAFGKPTNADGASSWRRALPAKSSEKDEKQEQEASEAAKDSEQISEVPTKHSEEHQPHSKTRQPKMPAGSVVAYIRDSRIDAVEADPKPLVNFIVTSELDDPADDLFGLAGAPDGGEKLFLQTRNENGAGGTSINNGQLSEVTTAESSLAQSSPSSSSPVDSKLPESKTPDNTTTRSGISTSSPSHQSSTSSPWGRASLGVPVKDSSARAPDPEHLKAVWSQPANKSDLNPVNSLEGIADDLTLPFSIQEVKSEDGETPPPALPTTTSRLSLHEVTKAFQKVPSPSSSSSNHSRNPISPPSTNNTPATRSPYTYSPMPPNHLRPYEYSPMMSHSPSPTIIYPHQLASSPVPSRMQVNGHAQMYQAPMWIAQAPPATPGNHTNVMRPMMTPYTTPMMAYPSPNAAMYAHPMGTLSTPQPPVGTTAGRGRGMPMMSPAITHAHAHASMYAGSPVMMPAQPMPHQNYTAYMGVHPSPVPVPGRGQQQRTDMSQNHQQSTPNAAGQQSHPQTYNPTSYVRSTW